MNSNDDQQLESAVRRELKALPELPAPAALINRVMAAIELRQNAPWYRRSWTTWPVTLQVAAFATLLVVFGGLCLAGWELSHAQTLAQAQHQIGQRLSGFSALGNLLTSLASSVVLVGKKLGTPFWVACLFVAGMSYAVFLSLGTVYFRLAFGKR